MASHQEKITELEKRLEKLEERVFGQSKVAAKPAIADQDAPKLEDLKIPNDVLSVLRARIRKVAYMNLILILLYFSPRSLTYSHMMSVSKELKKPVSYEWLNTEFHRTKYSGLIRSESIPGSKEKTYSLNEPGRKRAETVLAELKAKS
jgi:hypothetical protein